MKIAKKDIIGRVVRFDRYRGDELPGPFKRDELVEVLRIIEEEEVGSLIFAETFECRSLRTGEEDSLLRQEFVVPKVALKFPIKPHVIEL